MPKSIQDYLLLLISIMAPYASKVHTLYKCLQNYLSINLSTHVTLDALSSKAVCLLLIIATIVYAFCVGSLCCNVVLSVLSSFFSIILLRMRESAVLL